MFDVMTPEHTHWDTFCDALFKKCKFTGTGKDATWTCGGGLEKRYARAILKRMKFRKQDIDMSMHYFEANGGMCDCEILFNVDR